MQTNFLTACHEFEYVIATGRSTNKPNLMQENTAQFSIATTPDSPANKTMTHLSTNGETQDLLSNAMIPNSSADENIPDSYGTISDVSADENIPDSSPCVAMEFMRNTSAPGFSRIATTKGFLRRCWIALCGGKKNCMAIKRQTRYLLRFLRKDVCFCFCFCFFNRCTDRYQPNACAIKAFLPTTCCSTRDFVVIWAGSL